MMDLNRLTPQGAATSDIKALLSKLFSGWSMGAGQAPTINQPGVSAIPVQAPAAIPAMPAAPTDAQAARIAQDNMNGPMTDANLPPSITRPRHRAPPPSYDMAAMDRLTAPLQEGQNANIDDATRQRALAWALRNNPQG